VLLALVTTGVRRSELINLDWRDLSLDSPQPSLLVRHGKGDKPRRQPLAPQLADELRVLQRRSAPPNTGPVFCGLAGGRLQPKVLAAIIKRAAEPRQPGKTRDRTHAPPHRGDLVTAGDR
jgi:integrase